MYSSTHQVQTCWVRSGQYPMHRVSYPHIDCSLLLLWTLENPDAPKRPSTALSRHVTIDLCLFILYTQPIKTGPIGKAVLQYSLTTVGQTLLTTTGCIRPNTRIWIITISSQSSWTTWQSLSSSWGYSKIRWLWSSNGSSSHSSSHCAKRCNWLVWYSSFSCSPSLNNYSSDFRFPRCQPLPWLDLRFVLFQYIHHERNQGSEE